MSIVVPTGLVACLAYALLRPASPPWWSTGRGQHDFLGAATPGTGSTEAVVPEADAKPAGQAEITYHWPILSAGRVTSCFGPRTLSGISHRHTGIDIAGRYGEAVYPSREGVVVHYTVSDSKEGYGTFVVLRHDDGTRTLYAHLQPRLQVDLGQAMGQDDALGFLGVTGFTTGPHLHFEVRDPGGTALNPAAFLKQRLHTAIFRSDDDLCWYKDVLAHRD